MPKFPSIHDLALALRDLNDNVEGECDVRLQVYPEGGWRLRYGDASYDQDHSGYWGASSIPGYKASQGYSNRFTQEKSKSIARDLIEQAKEHAAQ